MAITLTSTSTTGALKVNGQDVITTDATGEVSLRTGGDLLTPNEFIKSNLNAIGDAPIYACRAWGNFNGTGTVAIRASGNVTSITDNGTGNYTVNFTTPMPDANYGISLGGTGTNFIVTLGSTLPSTTSFSIIVYAGNTADPRDLATICFSTFR